MKIDFKTIFSKMNSFLAGKTVLNIALIICATVFLFSVYNISVWFYENKNTDDLKNTLIEMGNKNEDKVLINQEIKNEEEEVDVSKIKFLTTDIDELQNLNADTVAWIKVMGTNVDYPVVQTDDNDFYLTHDFNKNENKAGWVFGDFRCNFYNLGYNTILYGHERMDYSMFGSLTFCRDDWWYNVKTNHFIFLNTATQKTVWQIFSIYVTTVDFNYIKTGFSGEEDFSEFVQSLNDRNTIPTLKADATSDDKIITLSTCYNISKRLVVHGKLIKSESIYPSFDENSQSSSSDVSSDISSEISSDISSDTSGSASSEISKPNESEDNSSSSDVSSEESSSQPDSSSEEASSDSTSSEESSSSEVSEPSQDPEGSSSEKTESSDISSSEGIGSEET
ncbi:MAG: class B sortase [Ruminococcaceae bacterium]|nr:class B sortase [Oscillospiraceae bacterium]